MTREEAQLLIVHPGITNQSRARLEAALACASDELRHLHMDHEVVGTWKTPLARQPKIIKDRIRLMLACIDFERIHRAMQAVGFGGDKYAARLTLREIKWVAAKLFIMTAKAPNEDGWSQHGMWVSYTEDSGFYFSFEITRIEPYLVEAGIPDRNNEYGYRLPSSAAFNMAAPAGSMRPGSHTK